MCCGQRSDQAHLLFLSAIKLGNTVTISCCHRMISAPAPRTSPRLSAFITGLTCFWCSGRISSGTCPQDRDFFVSASATVVSAVFHNVADIFQARFQTG